MGKKFPGAMRPEDVVVNIIRDKDRPMIIATMLKSRCCSFSAQHGSADTLVPDLYMVAGGFPEKIHHCVNCKFPNPTKNMVGAHAIVFASICQKHDVSTKLVIQIIKTPLGTFNDELRAMYFRGNCQSVFEE